MALSNYEVRGELARGGMGVVLRAYDRRLERDVAIKRVLSETNAVHQKRFQREGAALARVQHPNVVAVHEAGLDERGQPYLVMEFVEGRSLQDRIDREGPLPVREAVEILRGVADALASAHALGVLHRDLKPDNVLLTSDGTPKVTDFGMVKALDSNSGTQLTQTGQFVGTPGYWPPEQVTGDHDGVGPASDVYGLGGILYAMLTGEPPVKGASLVEILVATEARPPEPPSQLREEVDRDLNALCLKCLEKNPADRFQSASELVAALNRWLSGPPSPAKAPAKRFGPNLRRLGRYELLLVASYGVLVPALSWGPLYWLTRSAGDGGLLAALAVVGALSALVAALVLSREGAPVWRCRPLARVDASLCTTAAALTWLLAFSVGPLARLNLFWVGILGALFVVPPLAVRFLTQDWEQAGRTWFAPLLGLPGGLLFMAIGDGVAGATGVKLDTGTWVQFWLTTVGGLGTTFGILVVRLEGRLREPPAGPGPDLFSVPLPDNAWVMERVIEGPFKEVSRLIPSGRSAVGYAVEDNGRVRAFGYDASGVGWSAQAPFVGSARARLLGLLGGAPLIEVRFANNGYLLVPDRDRAWGQLEALDPDRLRFGLTALDGPPARNIDFNRGYPEVDEGRLTWKKGRMFLDADRDVATEETEVGLSLVEGLSPTGSGHTVRFSAQRGKAQDYGRDEFPYVPPDLQPGWGLCFGQALVGVGTAFSTLTYRGRGGERAYLVQWRRTSG